MDYNKIYNSIIEKAKNEKRKKGCDVYYENHHIIPKCLGGTNKSSNMVLLTGREHFICHWILHILFPNNNKIFFAFDLMCVAKSSKRNKFTPSSRIIEYSRKEKSLRMSGDNNAKYWKGKKRPDTKPLSEETKLKISNKLMGHTVSEESKIKQKETKAKNKKRPWNYGVKTGKLTEEQKNERKLNRKKNKIIQTNKNNEIIKIYDSVSDIILLKEFTERVRDCLNGSSPFYKGYCWYTYNNCKIVENKVIEIIPKKKETIIKSKIRNYKINENYIVIQTDKDNKIINIFESVNDVIKNSDFTNRVGDSLSGKVDLYKGFRWYYKKDCDIIDNVVHEKETSKRKDRIKLYLMRVDPKNRFKKKVGDKYDIEMIKSIKEDIIFGLSNTEIIEKYPFMPKSHIAKIRKGRLFKNIK